MFFCPFLYFFFLVPPFHNFPLASDFPVFFLFYLVLPFFLLTLGISLLLSSILPLPFPCFNLSIIYFLPTSHLSLSPPSLLHHSIFVLVQLQKWDLAVTNLLAKPPRAPCGGASSQRTRVIDWTWGKLCQAGHHDWISCLIINSLLPQVLWGDTSVMRRIFMTHGALDC